MSLPRMSWHIGDYKKDTGHLRAAGHGAYFLLCMHYWATGGLPDDDKQLAAIAGMTDREWKAHRGIIKALFKGDGGPWKHKRIDQELLDAQEKYDKLSKAGRDGNAKRWGSQKPSPPDRPPIPKAMAMGSQPITDNQEKDSDAIASGAAAPPEAPDPRKELFDRSLPLLASLTGKTPSSIRSLVAKWLKSCSDEAIHVVAAIDDAATDRVVDPVSWIEMRLKPRMNGGNFNGQAPRNNGITAVIDRKLAEIGREERPRDEMRENPPRLLSHG